MRLHGSTRRATGAVTLAMVASLLAPAASAEAVDQAEWVARKAQVTLLANRHTVSYVEMGNPDGPPVLLLHGIGDTSRSWSLIAPYLSGFRVIMIDQRGHGDADRPECCYAPVDFAWDAVLFLDAMKIERAHVVGHSLGTMVAQTLAANWPDRVGKLVLVASTPGPAVTRGDWLWTEAHKLKDPVDPEGEFVQALQSGPNPIDSEFRGHVVRETAAIPARVWRAAVREMARTLYAPLAADIKAPVLILWGGKDEMFGADVQAALRQSLPQAKFTAYPGYGHNLHWEAPKETGTAIAAFLRK